VRSANGVARASRAAQPGASRQRIPPATASNGSRNGGSRRWYDIFRRRDGRFDRRWLAFIPALLIVLLAAMYASVACSMTPPEQVILGKQGLEILDRNGKVLYTIGDEPGSSRIVPLEEISPHVINATLATEDADFWDNPGVNVKGLLRAAYENVAFWETGGLFQGSGGSSITQQLAKNLYIPPDERAKRSPFRKLKETIIAFELSRRYDKEDILSWYLSNIFYGQGAYGIESASYRYLNKPPSDLTLAEAALLVGIPRAPAFYDPLTNWEAAKARQQEVLGLMVRHHVITQADADAATAEAITLREGRIPESAESNDDVAAHFAFYVRDLLPSLVGNSNAQKQLRITTTLDYDLQVKANDIVSSNLDRFEQQYDASNGALVAMDPKTGEILAMVGSHDFRRDDISGQVNNALTLNQTGSTIKPVTYLAAFLKGWAPATIVRDEPLQISNGPEGSITLNNADKRYRGDVPVRVALGSSLNVPAVKALRFAELEHVYNLARRMGITTLKDVDQYGDAFTLGGADATLLDMTYVFSVFANQGTQAGIDSVLDLPSGNREVDPVAVLKVETVDGKTLWTAKPKQERIVTPAAAYLVTNVLADDSARVSGFGANSSLNLGSRPGAVKSGSSDDTRDAWAIGYTPQLVAGVWVGNANNAPMPGGTSTFLAAPIWRAFMLAALEGEPVQNFQMPDGVRVVKVCRATGEPRTSGCGQTVDEIFLDSNARAPAPTREPQRATPVNTPTAAPATPTPAPTEQPRQTPTRTPVINTPTQTRTPPPSTNTPRPTSTRPPLPTSPPSTSTPRSQAPGATSTPDDD
jgi:membrane peptidoglycan carboxypeptidase